MTGLLMWNVGDTHGTPLEEEAARAQTEPIRQDGDLAEAAKAPDWNELDTDESGQLTGLARREVGSFTVDTEQYLPWWAALASEPHNIAVDKQVASSGTAAQRELAGDQGHGTMQYAIGIEPVIRDGAAFGNDYFVSNNAEIQDGAGNYMVPVDNDNWAHALSQSVGTTNAREAAQASLYGAFLSANG